MVSHLQQSPTSVGKVLGCAPTPSAGGTCRRSASGDLKSETRVLLAQYLCNNLAMSGPIGPRAQIGDKVMTTSERICVTSQTSHRSAESLTRASSRAFRYVAGILRLSLGWVFLWAFLDKAIALGFNTGRNPDTGSSRVSVTPPGSTVDPRRLVS